MTCVAAIDCGTNTIRLLIADARVALFLVLGLCPSRAWADTGSWACSSRTQRRRYRRLPGSAERPASRTRTPSPAPAPFGLCCEALNLAAAKAIADMVGDKLSEDYIVPDALDKSSAEAVSQAVKEAAIRSGVARI